jgi:chitin synthase
LNQDKKKEKAVAESLKDFRNKVAFAFFFVNGLWLVIMTAMNEVKGLLNMKIPTVGGASITIEPLGLLFLVLFTILLLLQFIGMIKHRYGTFQYKEMFHNYQAYFPVLLATHLIQIPQNLFVCCLIW